MRPVRVGGERGQPASVSLALPRTPDSLAMARGAVRDYVRAFSADDALAYAAQLATSEVVATFLAGNGDRISLDLERAQGRVDVTVAGLSAGQATLESSLRSRLLDALTDDVSIHLDAAAEHVSVRLTFTGMSV